MYALLREWLLTQAEDGLLTVGEASRLIEAGESRNTKIGFEIPQSEDTHTD